VPQAHPPEDVPIVVELRGGGSSVISERARAERPARGSWRTGSACRWRRAGSDVALDGEGELGEVLDADDLAELALGFEHAGRGPAQTHVAGLPALDVARCAPDELDHRLDRVGRGERAPQLLVALQALQRDRLGQALVQRRRGAGVRPGELGDEALQGVERKFVVGLLSVGA